MAATLPMTTSLPRNRPDTLDRRDIRDIHNRAIDSSPGGAGRYNAGFIEWLW
jgi:hypothetical protein